MGEVIIRKSWCVVWVGLGLVLCLAGCQTLFPKPVYTPPAAPAPAAPPPSPVVRPTFYVAVNRLNLRACPGMDCPKIAVIERNEEVEKLGEAEDWSQIRVKRDGTIGWVSSRYLSATPVAAAPEAAPPPTPAPEVKPPPLPEKPEKAKPAKPEEVPPPSIKKKPEETRPAKPTKPVGEEAPAPEKPLIPEKPAKPAPPAAKPTPPEKPTPPPAPEPEKPSQIRIM